jgi:hypothetical protein
MVMWQHVSNLMKWIPPLAAGVSLVVLFGAEVSAQVSVRPSSEVELEDFVGLERPSEGNLRCLEAIEKLATEMKKKIVETKFYEGKEGEFLTISIFENADLLDGFRLEQTVRCLARRDGSLTMDLGKYRPMPAS